MKRILIALSILMFSYSLLAAPAALTKKQTYNMKHNLSLLGQPLSKQKQCAKLGYIGYQNALSAVYGVGNVHRNKVNPVKAYAWSLVAYDQILKTKNKKLIKDQQKALRFVAKKSQLTAAQKHQATKLANSITKRYSKNWPTVSTQMKMKYFPKPCNLGSERHS